MRPSRSFYLGLGLFTVLVIVLWLVGIQAIAQYLWHLLAGLSRV